MRSTATHVFFWGGPFSNWHRSGFSGKAALAELLPLLADTLQIDRDNPPEIFSTNHPLTRKLIRHRFCCGEQWMMAVKAWFFRDPVRFDLILLAQQPREHKAFGRQVSNFDAAAWDRISIDVVTAGSIARFAANPKLLETLLNTGNKVLVEGSPMDRTWGVGLSWGDPKILDPRNWRGKNYLGKALIAARDTLRERSEPAQRFAR